MKCKWSLRPVFIASLHVHRKLLKTGNGVGMFKFVVPSSRTGFGHPRRRDDDSGRPKERRTGTLLNFLNKQQDKDSHPYESKGALETANYDQGKDLRKTPPAKLQRTVTTTISNTHLFRPKHIVTLEENEGVKNPHHIATTKCVAGEKESFRGEELPSESLTEGRLQSRSRLTGSCACYGKEKLCHLPRGRGRARPRSTGSEIADIRSRTGAEMTHDRYSVSDSDGDSNSRSPILLTASPPQTALKVPATRLVNSPFINGCNYNFSDECGNREVDENSNYVETTGGQSSREARNVDREASDLHWLSSRNNARFTKYVAERPNVVQERLFPQEPHSFQSKTVDKLCLTSLRGSQVATSGQLFLDGPLFSTDDGCDEDYYEHLSDEEITKEATSTERTITESLYSISKHNGPLCYPNGGMTFDNYIGANRAKNVEKIYDKSRYYDRPSKEGCKYEDVISDHDANGKLSWNIEAEHCVLFPVHKRKQRPSEQLRQEAKDYFTMSKKGFGNSNTKPRFKGPMSGKNRGRKLRLSDKDGDDDATTPTLVTNSDQEELSSSSSSSERTTRQSIENSPGSNNRGQFLKEQAFVIEKVEHFSVMSSELNGFNGVYSPEERRASLQRSISNRSGKLRDRLNAVTDDEGCLYGVTPRGSAHFLHADDLYNTEHYSGSELDMPLTSHPSSAEISPSHFSHARVSQLKGEEALGRSRTSRSLTRLPSRKGSPAQARRCRSLDRGLRSSFTSALSPSHSDTTGQRSFVNFLQRGGLGSDSDLFLSSSLNGKQTQRKSPSTCSLVDRYKPKIDVAESLSALILRNPIKGSENGRETLNEYLKRPSWNNSKEEVVYSTADLRLGPIRRNHVSSPAVLRRSYQNIPGSSCGGLSHCKRLDVDDQVDSVLSKSSTASRPRESKIISKSQTPNRYPAVASSSPRSITSLLPSPRRDMNAAAELIAIIDNEVSANEIADNNEQVGRRNSFLEAVTGNSSLSGHSNNSELYDYGEDVEQAFCRLVKSVATRNSTVRNVETQSQAIERINSANLIEIHPDEVNVNLTTDPISNDLTVAVIRRPSTRSQSTSSEPASPMVKQGRSNHMSGFFHQNDPAQSRPPEAHGSMEPLYVNVLPNLKHPNSGLSAIVTVKCRNPHCRKEMCLEDAKAKFKSCHHCYTYYCSQRCRLDHWERHKVKCVLARVNNDCKKILRMGRDEGIVRQAFTRVARTGYLSRGRGCVQVIFSCPEKAERFIAEGLFALESLPIFRTVQELSELKARLVDNSDLITNGLIEACGMVYDAEKSYVLQVLIDIPDETFAKYERPYRHQNSHGVYLHTTNPVFRSKQDVNSHSALQNTPETLILTPPTAIPETWRLTSSPVCSTYSTPPPMNSVSSSPMHCNALPGADATRDAKRARQLCFINIQRKLREKGVTLRHQYPEVYKALCAYVDTGAHFTPVVIYPQDTRTRKHFMCLVMPGSEPQILGWVQTPGLLDDIATA